MTIKKNKTFAQIILNKYSSFKKENILNIKRYVRCSVI